MYSVQPYRRKAIPEIHEKGLELILGNEVRAFHRHELMLVG